jgi:hypothetical protein
MRPYTGDSASCKAGQVPKTIFFCHEQDIPNTALALPISRPDCSALLSRYERESTMADLDEMTLDALRPDRKGRHLSIMAEPWGYIVRAGNRPPLDLLILQVLAYFLGVCFVTAGIGILVLPALMSGFDLGPLRMGAAVLFGAGAVYLLWFASRGSKVDVHVDTTAREIREVIANRVGKPTVLKCYAFGDIGGIYVETAAGDAPAQLVLGYRGRSVLIALGETEELDELRKRLSRDLMGPLAMDHLVTRRAPDRKAAPKAESRAA